MKYTKIENKLKKVLSEKRYEHTMGVSFTSASLAMKYGEDVDKARLAGLLHDCAKYLDDDKLISLSEKYNLGVSENERRSPYLLHGKVGALIARKKFEVEDEDILNAITYHTTGRIGMSLLEKIVFIADYIEPQRDIAPNLDSLRKLAFEDIDMCVLKILEDTINYLKENGREVDPNATDAYDYYMKEKIINV